MPTTPRVSLFLFGLPITEYTPLVETAESAGYSTVWLGDHLILPEHATTPNPYRGPGGPATGLDPRTPLVDVWSVLAHAARSTSSIGLGTGVYILPLRNVFVTARAAATVQALSGGRLVFGVGTGWLREEFEVAGEDFEQRGRVTDDLLDVLPRLWAGDALAFEGRSLSFPEVRFAPPSPSIPILVGGTSAPALRRAAARADGWFGPACDLAAALEARRTIEGWQARLGRTSDFRYYVRPDGPVTPDVLADYAAAGFGEIVVSLKQLAGDSPPTTPAERVAVTRDGAARLGLTP